MDRLDHIVMDSNVSQERRHSFICVHNKISQIYKRGFTLVEMLVVMGTISLLIAITLPTLSRARRLAKRTVCAVNLRQIGIGEKMYATDNKDYLPWSGFRNGQAYHDFALQYLSDGKVFLCPGDKENMIGRVSNWKINKDDSVFASYLAQNYGLEKKLVLRTSQSRPAEIATFWDVIGGYSQLLQPMNHGVGGGNLLYLDGHVTWLIKDKWEKEYKPQVIR